MTVLLFSISLFVCKLHMRHIFIILFLAYTFIGNSSGTFVSASEDNTGILDFVERKIAKATMIPRSHGEVCFLVELLLPVRWLFLVMLLIYPHSLLVKKYFSFFLVHLHWCLFDSKLCY